MRRIAERIPGRLAVSTVIGDGSCGLHAIARIMQDAVNAQLTEHEICRELGHRVACRLSQRAGTAVAEGDTFYKGV